MQALPMMTPSMVSMAFTLSARRACTATWNVSPQTIVNIQFIARARGHGRNRVFSTVLFYFDAKPGACPLHSGGVRNHHQHHLSWTGLCGGVPLPPRITPKSSCGVGRARKRAAVSLGDEAGARPGTAAARDFANIFPTKLPKVRDRLRSAQQRRSGGRYRGRASERVSRDPGFNHLFGTAAVAERKGLLAGQNACGCEIGVCDHL